MALYLYYNCTEVTKRVLRLVYVAFSLVLFIDVIYYNYFNQLVAMNQICQCCAFWKLSSGKVLLYGLKEYFQKAVTVTVISKYILEHDQAVPFAKTR